MGVGMSTAVGPDQAAAVDLVDWISGHLGRLTVVGIGAGELSGAWAAAADVAGQVVFDPLAPESESDGCTVRAVAVSAHGGREQLNITRRHERSSLLEPNERVLRRRGDAAEFEVVDRREVPATSVAEVARELGGIDVLRLDISGLEYEVLSSALPVLDATVCIAVHGGMVDNYVGQYPFGVVSALLHGTGFSLMDLTCDGEPPDEEAGPVRPLEYRGLWLRDPTLLPNSLDFPSAVKLLILAQRLGHAEFARRLSAWLRSRSLLPGKHERALRLGGLDLLSRCTPRHGT